MSKLTTWDPFREIDEVMNRYPFSPRALRHLLRGGDEAVAWSPSADISETDAEYLIKADLPGVKKEDVKVTLGEGLITLSGERKEEKEAKGENQIRVERFYGQFSRSFSLPKDAQQTGINAKNENGILTIHIPKAKGTKPAETAIPVK